MIAIKAMAPGKAAGADEVRTEVISACGEVDFNGMIELCQWELRGKRKPDEWKQVCWNQYSRERLVYEIVTHTGE